MMNRVKNLLSADNVNLNDWEQGFLDSILSQLKRKRPLSAKQVQMIQKIEGRIEKHIRDYPAWLASWDDTKEKNLALPLPTTKSRTEGDTLEPSGRSGMQTPSIYHRRRNRYICLNFNWSCVSWVS